MTLSYIDPFAVPSTGSIDQRKVAIIAAYIARHRDGFSPNVLDPPMVAELTLVPAKSPRQRKPRYVPPDGLHTMAEAAQRLGCSIKTLNGHVASGALGYVAIGHGKKRPRKMFTDADLDDFIASANPKGFAVSVFRRLALAVLAVRLPNRRSSLFRLDESHDPARSRSGRARRAREGQAARRAGPRGARHRCGSTTSPAAIGKRSGSTMPAPTTPSGRSAI